MQASKLPYFVPFFKPCFLRQASFHQIFDVFYIWESVRSCEVGRLNNGFRMLTKKKNLYVTVEEEICEDICTKMRISILAGHRMTICHQLSAYKEL